MTRVTTQGRLKHFGWGREGEGLTPAEEKAALDRYCRLFGVAEFDEAMPPPLAAIELPPPRLVPPAPPPTSSPIRATRPRSPRS